MRQHLSPASHWQAIIPVLEVADVDRSIEYYCRVLGFSEAFRYRDPPRYGGLSRDGFEIHLRRVDHRPRRTTIYIPISNVDAVHRAAAKNGARIRNLPCDQLYGMREFDLEDPDGHVLCFGQSTDEAATG